jgi:hypothetical protein
MKRSETVCARQGWCFLSFVADTYGALRSDARQFVVKLIAKVIKANPYGRKELLAASVWQAVTSAVVSRAAGQLAAHAEFDEPLGMQLHLLDHPSLVRDGLADRDTVQASGGVSGWTSTNVEGMGTQNASQQDSSPSSYQVGPVPVLSDLDETGRDLLALQRISGRTESSPTLNPS